jgi:hypothetical protein
LGGDEGQQQTQGNNIPGVTFPFTAEYKLLTDFIVSVPRIKQERIETYIKQAESPVPIDNLQRYIKDHQNSMPKIRGPKASAISGILRDLPEENSIGFSQFSENSAFGGTPEIGVFNAAELSEDELSGNYTFSANFLRPSPDVIEEDDCMGDELSIDVSQDSLMIVPGMLPEPYWDFNMI